MASVDQPFSTDNDQQNQGQQQGQSGANTVQPASQLSGGSSVGGGAGSMGSTGNADTRSGGATAQQGTSNSGNFPNLNQYMTANQGWNQSTGGLGGAVAGNLNQGTNQVQSSVQNANNAFQNQGNNWAGNAATTNNAFQQGITDPYAYSQGQGANQQANQALNQAYTGPQNLAASNPNLANQAQNNFQNAQQSQTEGGRFNMLQQMFGGQGNYNSGEQTLDNALLQGSQSNMGQLQGATQKATQAQQNYQNTNNADTNAAGAWTNQGATDQSAARTALNNEIGNVSAQMAQSYTNAQANQGQQMAADTAGLNAGTITQAQAAQLGLSSLPNTYGVNAASYLNAPSLTEGNTATAQDYQNIGALQSLGGTNGAIQAPNSQFLSTYQNQPGTLYTPSTAVSMNPGFQAAVTQNQQAYQNAIQNWISQNSNIGGRGDVIQYTPGGDITSNQPVQYGGGFNIAPGANGMFNNAQLAGANANLMGNLLNTGNYGTVFGNASAGNSNALANLNSATAAYGNGTGLNIIANPMQGVAPPSSGPVMYRGGQVPKLRSMMR